MHGRYTVYNNNQTLFHYVGLTTWIKRYHSVPSRTVSLSNSFISISFLIVSILVFLGQPLPLVIWYDSPPSNPLSLLHNHESSLYMTNTPKSSFYYLLYYIYMLHQLPPMSSFLILSHLVLPHIKRNIIISDTLTLCSCEFFIVQHSISYNIVGLTAVR